MLIFSISCSDSNDSSEVIDDMATELAVLETEKLAIEELALSVPCTDEESCAYVAFGSKPCGGPWTYLVYNSNIDEATFLNRVEDFNKAEDAFNIKWNIVSDCEAPQPPLSMQCVNGKCTAIF